MIREDKFEIPLIMNVSISGVHDKVKRWKCPKYPAECFKHFSTKSNAARHFKKVHETKTNGGNSTITADTNDGKHD